MVGNLVLNLILNTVIPKYQILTLFLACALLTFLMLHRETSGPYT